MSLTGTGCSCQPAISVLIGALVATSAPTPTSLCSHWPFHNTNIPTVPLTHPPHPQAPEKNPNITKKQANKVFILDAVKSN